MEPKTPMVTPDKQDPKQEEMAVEEQPEEPHHIPRIPIADHNKPLSRPNLFGSLFHQFDRNANICILKFSKDQAKRKDEVQTIDGRDYGPDSVYRFIEEIGVIDNCSYSREDQAKIARLKIGRFNDVKATMGRRVNKSKLAQVALSLEEFHEQLERDYVDLAREAVPKQRILLLGTSNELLHPMLGAIFTRPDNYPPSHPAQKTPSNDNILSLPRQNRSVRLVILSNTADLRALYCDTNIHSGCGLRKFIEDNPGILASRQLEVIIYGVDDNMVTPSEQEYLSREDIKPYIKIVNHQGIDRKNPMGGLESLLQTDPGQYLAVFINLEVIKVVFPDISHHPSKECAEEIPTVPSTDSTSSSS